MSLLVEIYHVRLLYGILLIYLRSEVGLKNLFYSLSDTDEFKGTQVLVVKNGKHLWVSEQSYQHWFSMFPFTWIAFLSQWIIQLFFIYTHLSSLIYSFYAHWQIFWLIKLFLLLTELRRVDSLVLSFIHWIFRHCAWKFLTVFLYFNLSFKYLDVAS